MYESCVQVHYSRAAGKKQPFFVGKGNPGWGNPPDVLYL